MKQIFIATDHAGIELKENVVLFLKNKGFNVHDLGPHDKTSVDFPDYANKVCESLAIEKINSVGILICGSGQGMAMRANKFRHIRAALVYSNEISRLAREHNDANIICIGSRFCTAEQAQMWITTFLETDFAEGRHSLRVAKINDTASY